MKSQKILQFAVVMGMALAFSPVYGQSAGAGAPSTNAVTSTVNFQPNVAEVVKLSGAGLGNDVVLAYINSSHSLYNLSANQIVQLKNVGISPVVITAMLNHDSATAAAATVANNPTPASPAPTAPPANPDQYTTPPPSTADTLSAPPQNAPPAPTAPVEVVTVSPGADYYWAPGYWGWNGGWIWIGGGWRLHGGYYGWSWHGYGYRGGYYHRH